MKTRLLSFLLLFLLVCSAQSQTYQPTEENLKSRQEFRDNRFGIFLHWGIYSMLATGEWTMTNKNLNYKEYAKLAGGFYPAKFDAARWVSAIKASGAKYICFTSRHHDGFSMFHTRFSDYNIVDATPFKRDILKELADECHKQGIEYLKQFQLVDSEHEMNNLLAAGKSVLCEGAQGTMLDIDFGSYPFVTSSNTVCAGACTGLGIAPNKIGEVYGIFKAYCTRVGAGPFPTELFDKTGDQICTLGHEFGSVTGRKRRCGWIDLVALKYAIMVDGVTKLIMMKSDVLDSFETIKACVAYKMDEEEIDYFPFDINETVEPVYVELPGWQTDMTKMQSEDEFPEEFNAYLSFLEEQLGVPIKIVSLGPDREQTIERYTEE